MAKKTIIKRKNRSGSMLEQKTFQDFNNRKPTPGDPNESKSKLNSEDLVKPEQPGTPVGDETPELLEPVPGAPKSSSNKEK